MEQYTTLAYLYDHLMDHIDYKNITDYIVKIFKIYNLNPETILDLACGTGTITTELYRKGFRMIGTDISCDMLEVASSKSNNQILYLCQDMRNLELNNKVDAVICMFDSLNYITSYRDIKNIFKKVSAYLNDNGLFIFDMNTEYKLSQILGRNTYTYSDDKTTYIWENEYNKRNKICNFYLTFFVKENELYRKYEEQHSEKGYSIDEIEYALSDAGFRLKKKFKDYTFTKGTESCQRITYVAAKKI